MTCTYQGECPTIPPALMHTSIAAGKCERCEYNGIAKKKVRRGGRRR